jgi:exodeoxyribonuclease V
MTFSPSSEQARAIAGIKDWFWHRRGEQQVFSLFGYAGSGKSTLTAHAIAELGLDGESHALGSGGVLYAAFTGKAALVMTRKGTPASTIHSLIYRCSEATPEEIARVEQDLQDLRAGLGAMGPGERLFAETQIRHLELRLRDLHEPRFLLNEQSLLRDADLLVLDEVSMVGQSR